MSVKVTIELGNKEYGTSEHVHAYASEISKQVDATGSPFYKLEMVEGDILICQWIPSKRVFKLD